MFEEKLNGIPQSFPPFIKFPIKTINFSKSENRIYGVEICFLLIDKKSTIRANR